MNVDNTFKLSEKDCFAVKDFLRFPLKDSVHPAAMLFSHNSFAIFLAERVVGNAFVKDGKSKKQLISVREVFERLIFLRLRIVFSPAEIVAHTASKTWMRGTFAR
jgi:hypothetical protein